jgi:hypothetical protein
MHSWRNCSPGALWQHACFSSSAGKELRSCLRALLHAESSTGRSGAAGRIAFTYYLKQPLSPASSAQVTSSAIAQKAKWALKFFCHEMTTAQAATSPFA